MANGVEVFTVTVAFLTSVVNAYATLSNNRTTDVLTKAVSRQSNMLSEKWDVLNERFAHSQTQLDRFIELLGKQLVK